MKIRMVAFALGIWKWLAGIGIALVGLMIALAGARRRGRQEAEAAAILKTGQEAAGRVKQKAAAGDDAGVQAEAADALEAARRRRAKR